MNEEKELRRCRDAAYRLLARRDHAERELAVKLGRRFEPAVVETVLESLRGKGLLDDRRYALAFARELISKGPCGARLIRRKLGQRGIAPELVDEVLAGLELDEAEQAEEAVRLKLASLAGEDDETAARRLLAHLERRGFTGETARGAVLRALKRRPKESD